MSAPRPPASDYDLNYYENSCGGHEFYRAYGVKVLKPALAYSLKRAEIKAGQDVLDVGCGRGELLYHLKRMGAKAAGVDFSREAVDLSRKNSGCPVELCELKALPFPTFGFDRVFLIGVMDHVSARDLEPAFREIARVLKPGGFAVIHTCANRQYYKKLSYGLRLKASQALNLPLPSPPRSEEDAALHVNEQSLGELQRFFRDLGWRAEVEARPNYKIMLQDLYGENLPADFPLRAAARWKSWLYRGLIFRTPLARIMARELFAIARPRERLLK